MKDNSTSPDGLILFIQRLMQLKTIHFAGFLKILCVEYTDKDGKLRDLDELLSESIDSYIKTGRKQRREIDKLLRQILKGYKEEEKNG